MSIGETPVALALMARDVNIDYLTSHFHLNDYILFPSHEKSYTKVVDMIINPIYIKSFRIMMMEILRMMGKTIVF